MYLTFIFDNHLHGGVDGTDNVLLQAKWNYQKVSRLNRQDS